MDFNIGSQNSRNNSLSLTILVYIVKALKCFGIYMLYDLLKSFHIVYTLFLVTIMSAILMGIIQKSYVDITLKKFQIPYLKILLISFGLCITNLLWFFGLSITGALRTIFVFETHDLILVTFVSLFIKSKGGPHSPTKIRGGIFYIIALACFLFLDHDEHATNTKDTFDSQISVGDDAYIIRHLAKLVNLSDHKKGVCLLIVTMMARILVDKLVKKLSIEIGGLKKTNFFLAIGQIVVMAPLAFCTFLSSDHQALESSASQNIYCFKLLFICTFISLTIYVLNFYTEVACSVKVEKFRLARQITLASYLGAMLFYLVRRQIESIVSTSGQEESRDGFYLGKYLQKLPKHLSVQTEVSSYQSSWAEPHPLTAGAYIAMALFTLAIMNLTANEHKSSKGYFVGYSALSGLPLYSYTTEHLTSISHSLKHTLKNFFIQISRDQTSKPIFYFLLANLAFMLVEIVYGAWSNSLGLISDGFHMLFDCSALVMGLCAALMAKWKRTKTFSYGYGRVEILSGFLNGLFLILVSIYVFLEALDRLFEPPQIESEKLLHVSVVGLFINLIGIFAFHLSGNCSHSGHSHHQPHHGSASDHQHGTGSDQHHHHGSGSKHHHHHHGPSSEHHHHHGPSSEHHHGPGSEHHHGSGSDHHHHHGSASEHHHGSGSNHGHHHGSASEHDHHHGSASEHDHGSDHHHKHSSEHDGFCSSSDHQHYHGSGLEREIGLGLEKRDYGEEEASGYVVVVPQPPAAASSKTNVVRPENEDHEHGHAHHGHSHSHNMNMRGIFLHVLADTLGSVGVIVSSFLMQKYGWYIADPICSIFTSLLIFASVLPLITDTCSVLLLRTPRELQIPMTQCLDRIKKMEKVISYKSAHVWRLSSSKLVASLHVKVDSDTNPALQHQMSQKVISMLKSVISEYTGASANDISVTVQIENESFYKHLAGICALGYGQSRNSTSAALLMEMDHY